jgi:hypothetical protein
MDTYNIQKLLSYVNYSLSSNFLSHTIQTAWHQGLNNDTSTTNSIASSLKQSSWGYEDSKE